MFYRFFRTRKKGNRKYVDVLFKHHSNMLSPYQLPEIAEKTRHVVRLPLALPTVETSWVPVVLTRGTAPTSPARSGMHRAARANLWTGHRYPRGLVSVKRDGHSAHHCPASGGWAETTDANSRPLFFSFPHIFLFLLYTLFARIHVGCL